MNGFRRFLFFWTLLLWVANSSVSAIPKKDERNKSTQQSVLQAHIQGKIALSIRGIYNPNEPIRLRNISDSTLHLVLPCGTWLHSEDSSVQNMLITKNESYIIEPQQNITKKIYAMCGELQKNAPDIYIYYAVGEVAKEPLLRLAKAIQATEAQSKVGQYAVWAITDQATRRELGNNPKILQQSQELLNQANVNFNIFGETTVALREFALEDGSTPVLYDTPNWEELQNTENDSVTVNRQTMPIEPETIFLTHETAKLTDDNRSELILGIGILLVLGSGLFAFGRNYGIQNFVKPNFYVILPEVTEIKTNIDHIG